MGVCYKICNGDHEFKIPILIFTFGTFCLEAVDCDTSLPCVASSFVFFCLTAFQIILVLAGDDIPCLTMITGTIGCGMFSKRGFSLLREILNGTVASIKFFQSFFIFIIAGFYLAEAIIGFKNVKGKFGTTKSKQTFYEKDRRETARLLLGIASLALFICKILDKYFAGPDFLGRVVPDTNLGYLYSVQFLLLLGRDDFPFLMTITGSIGFAYYCNWLVCNMIPMMFAVETASWALFGYCLFNAFVATLLLFLTRHGLDDLLEFGANVRLTKMEATLKKTVKLLNQKGFLLEPEEVTKPAKENPPKLPKVHSISLKLPPV